MKNNLEYRSLEVRFEHDDDTKKLRGYAAVFNSLSSDLGGFRERIIPGAFTNSLNRSNGDVLALGFHDMNVIFGRQSAGTLELKEDGHGLFMEIDPPATTAANDIIENVKRGNLRHMSFGFFIKEDKFIEDDDLIIREITDVELIEVSIVSVPAYQATEVNLRDHGFYNEEKRKTPGHLTRLLKRIFEREQRN